MPITTNEFLDVERYLDVKRGEIYLGKGVILVEGIAEEYIVPKFAEILGKPLDEIGIIVCNINCTNFTPYVKLLHNLEIPYVVITDGDYYYIDDTEEEERHYHIMDNDIPEKSSIGFLGNEIIKKLMIQLGFVDEEDIPEDFNKQDELYNANGCFVGIYTFEVDMMNECEADKNAIQIIIDIFNELTSGGDKQKNNFKKEIENGEYWKCLSKIESNGIGKGRFAQKLAGRVCSEHIPSYIANAIDCIYQKVNV